MGAYPRGAIAAAAALAALLGARAAPAARAAEGAAHEAAVGAGPSEHGHASETEHAHEEEAPQVTFAWAPLYGHIEIEDALGNLIEGDELHPISFVVGASIPHPFGVERVEGELEIEWHLKEAEGETPTFDGTIGGWQFNARAGAVIPIPLDDAGRWRALPEIGVGLNATFGGGNADREFPQHVEAGPLLVFGLERTMDDAGNHRVGAGLEAAVLYAEVSVDDDLGALDQASDFRMQVWYRARILPRAQVDIRYAFTDTRVDFDGGRAIDGSGGKTDVAWREWDHALILGLILSF